MFIVTTWPTLMYVYYPTESHLLMGQCYGMLPLGILSTPRAVDVKVTQNFTFSEKLTSLYGFHPKWNMDPSRDVNLSKKTKV